MLVVKFSLGHRFLPAKMDVWGWLCGVLKYLVNATEVFIEIICSRVCIFNYVAIFVLNVVCGRIRFKTSKFMQTCP